MADVSCLGILVADLVGRPIDSLPPRGRLGLVDHMSLHMGGCASNTGIDLARLGITTSVLGKVGADGLGEFLANTLDREGVDVRGLVRDPNVGTSASMVIVDSEGERTFLHHLGGNARYTLDDVNWDAVQESKILHVAGALVMPGIDGEPMAELLKRAKQMGKTTTLDVVWDATGQWMKTLGPCLPYTDYFMPSLSEAQELTGLQDYKEVAKALRDTGVKTVGVKLGMDGCYILGPDGVAAAPAYRVQAVDGTGSGDAWDAGFLVGILNGWDLERIARFANAVGAFSVSAVGATAGVRSMSETEKFLAERAN